MMLPRRVLIDTNILLSAEETRLFQTLEESYPELEACVLEGTKRELESMARGKGGNKAKLALALIERQHLNTLSQSVEHVDDALIQEALREPAYLATQDKELQKKALRKGIRVLAIANHRVLREVVS